MVLEADIPGLDCSRTEKSPKSKVNHMFVKYLSITNKHAIQSSRVSCLQCTATVSLDFPGMVCFHPIPRWQSSPSSLKNSRIYIPNCRYPLGVMATLVSWLIVVHDLVRRLFGVQHMPQFVDANHRFRWPRWIACQFSATAKFWMRKIARCNLGAAEMQVWFAVFPLLLLMVFW